MNLTSITYYSLSISLFITAISLSLTLHNFNSIMIMLGLKSSNSSTIVYILKQAAKCLIPFYNVYILISEITTFIGRKLIKD